MRWCVPMLFVLARCFCLACGHAVYIWGGRCLTVSRGVQASVSSASSSSSSTKGQVPEPSQPLTGLQIHQHSQWASRFQQMPFEWTRSDGKGKRACTEHPSQGMPCTMSRSCPAQQAQLSPPRAMQGWNAFTCMALLHVMGCAPTQPTRSLVQWNSSSGGRSPTKCCRLRFSWG